MTLTASTLSSRLEGIENTEDEAEVRTGWRMALGLYFSESAVKGVSPSVTYDPGPPEILSTPYDTALDAFASALTGISTGTTAVEGATKIAAANATFWTSLAPLVATVWIVVPVLASLVTAPPGVLAQPAYITALSGIFASNMAGDLSKADAYAAIAALIHTNNQGATVLDTTTPTPLVWPVL